MYKPDHPRRLIDRKALTIKLEDIGATQKDFEQRKALLALLKDSLEQGRAEVKNRFSNGLEGQAIDGPQASRALAYLHDQLLRLLYDFVMTYVYPTPNPTKGEKLSLLAVGGYGRGELAPQSDIDLLFLTGHKETALSEQVVEYMLYMLWDLGLKVGQATRSVPECLNQARQDITIRTACLEMRYIWGDKALATDLRERFFREIVNGSEAEFIEAKLQERDQRHEKLGGSRYSLEPNIKDGKGGLRDLHTLFWIAKYVYQIDDVSPLVERGVLTGREAETFNSAHRFLWTLRFHMHYLSNRGDERLTFDKQTDIATLMNYTEQGTNKAVERFMRHYFLVAKDVGDLTRIFCAALEAEQKRKSRFSLSWLGFHLVNAPKEIEGFPVDRGRLTLRSDQLARCPSDMMRLFKVAHGKGLDIHPDSLRLITRNLRRINKAFREDPVAQGIFIDLLTDENDPEKALRRMNEAGVLGKFLPDFGRVVARMQYNMYHVYTVDEHTLMAIGMLNRIEQGKLTEELPIASEIIQKVLSRKVLYMAVFLHDIAKGRPGDHSIVGAKVAEKLCPRLGFSEEETETVAWLVRWHLLMSDTAFKRDVDDPKTVTDFAGLIQSPERLRLLLCLTVVDIRAVGPGVWNNWKATLLRKLYNSTESVLTGGLISQGRERMVARAKEEARNALAGWGEDEIATFLAQGNPSYWLSFDVDSHRRHAQLLREMKLTKAPLLVDSRIDDYHGVTEVTVLTADYVGLLPRLAGALALSGATIVNARVVTFDNGTALDSFSIQDVGDIDGDVGPFNRPEKLAKLSSNFHQVLAGDIAVSEALANRPSHLPARMNVFEVKPRVLIDNQGSNTHTILEINGRDRPGFLYLVTNVLTRLGLQISTAKISTYGERAIDVFYVKDVFGMKIHHSKKLEDIRLSLVQALSEG